MVWPKKWKNVFKTNFAFQQITTDLIGPVKVT